MSAITFCFLLLVASAWTDDQTAWTDDNPNLRSLDSIALPIISRIDNLLSSLDNGIEQFKSVTWKIIDTVKAQSDKIVNTVKDFVDYSSDKLELELSNLLRQNVSNLTCDLVGRFKEQADLVFNSARNCVEGPINKTLDEARTLSQTGTDIRSALQNQRQAILNCKKNATTFAARLLCFTTASNNTEQLLSKGSSYVISLVKIGTEVSIYTTNLQICIATTPLEVIRRHYLKILLRFPECITNKLGVTVSNVWDQFSSAYQSVQSRFTRNQIGNTSDLTDLILFPFDDTIPLNLTMFADFLKNQYPNLDIVEG